MKTLEIHKTYQTGTVNRLSTRVLNELKENPELRIVLLYQDRSESVVVDWSAFRIEHLDCKYIAIEQPNTPDWNWTLRI